MSGEARARALREVWALARELEALGAGDAAALAHGAANGGGRSLKERDLPGLKAAAQQLRTVLSGYNNTPGQCTPKQWRMICWQRRQLHWSDSNLRGFIQHVTGVEHERFLVVKTARQVIAGLKGVLGQARKKRAGDAP